MQLALNASCNPVHIWGWVPLNSTGHTSKSTCRGCKVFHFRLLQWESTVPRGASQILLSLVSLWTTRLCCGSEIHISFSKLMQDTVNTHSPPASPHLSVCMHALKKPPEIRIRFWKVCWINQLHKTDIINKSWEGYTYNHIKLIFVCCFTKSQAHRSTSQNMKQKKYWQSCICTHQIAICCQCLNHACCGASVAYKGGGGENEIKSPSSCICSNSKIIFINRPN